MQVLVTTTRSWYLRHTAAAFSARRSLAGLWMADKNAAAVPPAEYRRCWPYHLAMKPFYHCAPQIWDERATYWFVGLYERWLQARLTSPNCPAFQVAHGIMGFSTALFRQAARVGALKVLDCPNSHPTTYYGFWQRECDLWCPGERVPIPQFIFSRMNRELAGADLILCPSKFVHDMMVLNGVDPARCFVNPFGVDGSTFTARQSVPSVPRFICVGTICVRKGHQYLFRAFEQVKQALPKAELICVGEFKVDFRQERPKWEGTFTHYPSLPHAELNELMKTCTAFVLPSCEEGFARVIPEAMAAGLPIIASYESGATTLVNDGIEGLIVSHRPEHIAAAMLRLAADSELCAKMGAAARARGAISNSWQDYGDRLLAQYERRLSTR
jgi:glycosyltransferase involved in cell wall biosynthesis